MRNLFMAAIVSTKLLARELSSLNCLLFLDDEFLDEREANNEPRGSFDELTDDDEFLSLYLTE